MKWGLQHVKVTLQEEDSGETVVIEQRSDGQIRCERGKSGKGGKQETKAAPAEPKAAPEPAREAEKSKAPEKESARTTAKKTTSASGRAHSKAPASLPRVGMVCAPRAKRSAPQSWLTTSMAAPRLGSSWCSNQLALLMLQVTLRATAARGPLT